MTNEQSNFLSHILRRRLNRVPPEKLKLFLENQGIYEKHLTTKRKLLDKLMTHIGIMKENPKFNQEFNEFLRDFVLSAGVSEYILQVKNTDNVYTWINRWKDNKFLGQHYKFEVHSFRNLGQKFIKFEKDNKNNVLNNVEVDIRNINQGSDFISLPSNVIFLVASSLEEVSELNGLQEVSYHPTSEFEMIFREGINLVEVRGEYKVIRDFVATAVMDNDNPLSMAASLFIGEEKDTRNSLIKTLRARVGINELQEKINGSFLSIASIADGSKVSRIKMDVDKLKNPDEETDPILKEIIKRIHPNLDKGRISFKYKEKDYSFMITKTGGLRFYEYVPEEVVTYILYTINKLK